jgi:hypothetical protein
MPAWLLPAILSGLPAITNLFGARTAAKASDRASEISAQGYREALAQQRALYEQDRADFAPYLQAGGAAVTRMSDLLSRSAPPSLPASVQRRLGPARPAAPPATSALSFADLRSSGFGRTPQAQAGHGPTVRMEIRPGLIKEVPAEFVDTWTARGARPATG